MNSQRPHGDPHASHQIAELASCYAASALTPAQSQAFEAHLNAGCPACRAALREHDAALAALFESLSEETPSPQVWNNVVANLSSKPRLHTVSEQDAERGSSRRNVTAHKRTPRVHDARHDRADHPKPAPTSPGRAAPPVPAAPQVWRRWDSDAESADVIIRAAARDGWEETGIAGVAVRRLFVDRDRNQMTALVRMAPGTAWPKHVHDGPEECLVLEGDLHAGEHVFHTGDYQRMSPGTHHGVQATEGGCLLLIVSALTDQHD